MKALIQLSLTALVAGQQSILSSSSDSGTTKPIVIDTDMMTDVDDAGALAVANAFHNCGLCELKAVMLSTNSEYGALTASVINTYFGNGDLPIAALRPITNETFFDTRSYSLGDFASKVAHNWPRTLKQVNETPTPTELYLSLLEAASDNSLTIISIGFLTNLAALLDLYNGPDLLASKVRELVVMGGSYPSGWEWNFAGSDPGSTAKVLAKWPRNVPVTYSGYELGKNVLSGQKLQDHAPQDSPILAAYQWYNGRCRTIRESWDPLTVLYGVLGLEGVERLWVESPFAFANEYGYNLFGTEDGTNAWVNDSSVRNQHWLKLKDGVNSGYVSWMLTQIYAIDPVHWSCWG